MITLFVIGIIVFTGKLVLFMVKAAWGITKGVLFVVGLISLAVPLLILALLAAFLWPVLKGI